MQELTPPTMDKVGTVRLAVTCESILDSKITDDDERNHKAWIGARDYAQPLVDVVGSDHVDVTEEPEPSEYDGEWDAYHVTCHVGVTPEQWLRIADGYCMDLDWVDNPRGPDGQFQGRHRTDDLTKIPLFDPDQAVPTMGILGADGITPAVAIEHTDEGWDDFTSRPILIASFYVAATVKEPATT